MSAPLRLDHMRMSMDPLEGIGFPQGFGYVAGRKIGIDMAPPDVTADSPEQLGRDLSGMQKDAAQQRQGAPDIVRAMYAPPDKQLVYQLVQTATGGEGGLAGVPASLATTRLDQLGLPHTLDAWTASQWTAKLAELATQMPSSPLAVLGF